MADLTSAPVGELIEASERLRRENEQLRKDLERALKSIAKLMAAVDVNAMLNREPPPARRAPVSFPDGTRVNVEIADTRDRIALGLMFRDSLPEDEGMIFVYEEPGYYPFWMKNTRMPLDMLWLDVDGRIVAIQKSAMPCTVDPCPHYWPPSPAGLAHYCIEVVAGVAAGHGLAVGDVIDLADVRRVRSVP
jgi:uncharacterized protein